MLKRIALIVGLAASMCVAACAPMQAGIDPVVVSVKIDEAQARYDVARPVAEMVLPYLPASTQARVRLGLDVIARALTAARIAATVAEQQAALDRAEHETEKIEALTVDPE